MAAILSRDRVALLGRAWWRTAKHALDGAAPLAVLSPASGRSMLNGRTVNDNALISRQGGIKYVVGADGVLSAVPANSLAYDWSSGVRELLLEGRAANSLRNSTMQGTVVGSPGTTPTYWVVANSGTSGITRQIVGSGTVLGMPYIDIRWYGEATGTAVLNMHPEASTSVPAASGDTWTMSAYLALVGGSLAGCLLTFGLTERSSAGSALNANTPVVAPGGSLTRYAATLAFVNASTTYVGSTINLVPTAVGSVIDVTVRIAAPQLEKSPTATSCILTSGAAVTRPADIAPLWSGAGNATAWSLRVGVPNTGAFWPILGASGGYYIRMDGSGTGIGLDGGGTHVTYTAQLPGYTGYCGGWGTSGRRAASLMAPALGNTTQVTYSRASMFVGAGSGLVAGQVLRLRELVAWQLPDRPSAAGCQAQARLWSA